MERLTYRTNQRVYLKKFDCPYDMPIQKRLFCIGCHKIKIGNRENCRPLKVIDRLAAYEDTELTPEQVATLKAENEMLKSLTSGIPLDRLEEICKAYKEDRILILPKCPQCGLVNAWGLGKRVCDRCGASLSGGDV